MSARRCVRVVVRSVDVMLSCCVDEKSGDLIPVKPGDNQRRRGLFRTGLLIESAGNDGVHSFSEAGT